jgi:hypothetical protein
MRTVDRRKNNGSKLVPEHRSFFATSRTLLQTLRQVQVTLNLPDLGLLLSWAIQLTDDMFNRIEDRHGLRHNLQGFSVVISQLV